MLLYLSPSAIYLDPGSLRPLQLALHRRWAPELEIEGVFHDSKHLRTAIQAAATHEDWRMVDFQSLPLRRLLDGFCLMIRKENLLYVDASGDALRVGYRLGELERERRFDVPYADAVRLAELAARWGAESIPPPPPTNLEPGKDACDRLRLSI